MGNSKIKSGQRKAPSTTVEIRARRRPAVAHHGHQSKPTELMSHSGRIMAGRSARPATTAWVCEQSGAKKYFDRAPLVHGLVAIGDFR
jgi:hypothetical protein